MTKIKLNKFYRLKDNNSEVWKIQEINNNQITLVDKQNNIKQVSETELINNYLIKPVHNWY